MKIALIGHKRIPSRDGGVEVVLTELAPRLAKLGAEVVAYNRYTGGEKLSEWNGVAIREVKTPRASSLNALIYSIRAAFRASFSHFDVIHFHAEGPCAAILVAKLFGQRTVATIHGLDWRQPKWGKFAKTYLKFGERTAAKHSDELIVLSPVMRKYFADTYGRESTLIPNGVTPVKITPPDIIREKFGLERRGYLLFLARITPVKRLDLLIDAFMKLDTDMKLVVAGEGDMASTYMQAVTAQAKSDSRIIFTGFVSGELLDSLYSNCFAYILPSDSEGMPISLLEAISAHARCLVSDIPEITGVAPDYLHTFAHGDAASLGDKLEFMTANPQLRACNFGKSDSEAAADSEADRITAAYSQSAVAEATMELYRKAARSRRRKRKAGDSV